MFLFELAMELDERSADMAEAASSLGFEGVTPTTELTSEQVQAFRARFTKAAVLDRPGAGSDDGAYHPPTWGPPEGSAGPPPPAPSERSMGIGQMVVIALVIVGVIGLFAFMFTTGGTDQKRLDRIASAAPSSDEVPPTGPDGKPLTKEQRQNVATLEAAKAANEQKICAAVGRLGDADVWGADMPYGIDTIEGMRAYFHTEADLAMPAYDEVATVAPEQAANVAKVKQFVQRNVAVYDAATNSDTLRAGGAALGSEAVAAGWYDAEGALNTWAEETCDIDLPGPT